MKLTLLCFGLLCVSGIFTLPAQETDEKAFDLVASNSDGLMDVPPLTFNLKEVSAFNAHLPKVNVITGEYCEEECDLIVAGIEPLSFRRFYGHLGFKDETYGHWRVNPESIFFFGYGNNAYGAVGFEDGSFGLYDRLEGDFYKLNAKKNRNFTNGEAITGQNHPLNTRVTLKKVKQRKDKRYYWEGTIYDGNGRQRSYQSSIYGDDKYHDDPLDQGKIVEDKKPNGNILRYTYRYNESGTNYRTHYAYRILESIDAYSSRGILLGTLKIYYGKGSHDRLAEVSMIGSDGRHVVLHHQIRKVQNKHGSHFFGYTPAIYDTVLKQVDTSWKPTQYYEYRWEHEKTYFVAPFMYQASQESGCMLETLYDPAHKVLSQSLPVGPNGQMVPIARYTYHDNHTIVYDGEDNKTIYRFNNDDRITAIEKYQKERLLGAEKKEYNPSTGNVIKKTVADSVGKLLAITEYRFDDHQNAIEEKIGGIDVITRTFTNDGFNLIETESDRPGKSVKYTYVPQTNLVASEMTFEQDRILKRVFHFYDDQIGSAKVKTIIDDGQSLQADDLTGVTYRRIFDILPRRTLPCVGLTDEIKEKTIDIHGNEILLGRVCYSYHPSGKIEKEDHYDAYDHFRYSCIHTYDEKERLIATKDPLGNTTHFAYDSNFNLVAQSGPKADMRKEWVYDRANRPVLEKEWQTDGTVLVTKKVYDKTSRVIATIDECGFETRYEHDALGNITAICYPDGSVARKLYDFCGNLLAETDCNGFTTRYEYDLRSRQTAIYRPDGSTEFFAYNPHSGTLSCHTDAQGTKTFYSYDIFDRPVRTETYGADQTLLKQTFATYSAFNKLSETDGEGNTTHFQYDYAGRKIAEDKNGKVSRYFYDALGRLNKTQEGDAVYEEEFDLKGQILAKKTLDLSGDLQSEEHYSYDEAGNQTQIINSKGTSETVYDTRAQPILKKDALGFTTHFQYDYANGFTKTETDAIGIQTIHLFDARGNALETCKKNAAGEEIQKVNRRFDGNKNLIEEKHVVFEGIIPTKTIVHRWTYGPCNRLEKLVEAGQKETLYTYDASGKLSQLIKPDKTALNSNYDALSRLARFFSKDFDYSYLYDRNDRILSVFEAKSASTTARQYDHLGNMTQEILGNGLTLVNAFDNHGRRVKSRFPDGSYASFSYKANQLYQIARTGLTYTYSERDLEGHLSKIELPAHLGTISIERDPLSRWKTFASPFYKAVFSQESYDPVGNLCQYQFSDAIGTKQCSFVYDDLQQLTAEDGHFYAHDSLHNRLIKDEHAYSINDLCEIAHDGETPYEYDENGNLTFDGKIEFSYDTLDRLISIEKEDLKTDYTYDAFNRRLSKTVCEHNQSRKELYFYDGDNEIGSTDIHGNILELRILGEGLGAEIGASVLLELQGKTYIPIHDHRGSLVTLIDPLSQKPVETHRYTAYGEKLSDNQLSPWGFSSKRSDPETGLSYFGRRYYSPSLGRWLTTDPQGFADGPNLYAYLHNNPLTDFDLYGLWSMGGVWNGSRGFVSGMYHQSRDYLTGFGHSFAKMGQWMHADFQYEHCNDRSFFHDKSLQAVEGWKNLGRAAKQDPLGMLASGVMDAWRNPTSPAAWGRAAVDVGMLAFSAAKLGQAGRLATQAGRTGRVSQELYSFGKPASIPSRISEPSSFSAFHYRNLINQLAKEEACSAFTQRGTLSKQALAGSREIIAPSQLQNSNIPNGFGKYSTETFRAPSGGFQVHYYKHPTTGEVFYNLDYKSVFTGRKKMKVKHKQLNSNLKQNVAGWITEGEDYHVLSIIYDERKIFFYRIIGDDGITPALFESNLFVPVSSTIPSNWTINFDGNIFQLAPLSWLTPGFWEKYFDGDHEAREIFSAEYQIILGFA